MGMVFNYCKKHKSPYASLGEMNLWQRIELVEDGELLKINWSWLDEGNNSNKESCFVHSDCKTFILSYLQHGDVNKVSEFSELLNDACLCRHCQSGGRESIPQLNDFQQILDGVILIGEGGEMVGPWSLYIG